MEQPQVTLLSEDKMSALVNSQIEDILAKKESSLTPVAEMEKPGALDSLTSIKFMRVPIGQAAVGGITAMVLSSLVEMAMKPVRQQLGTRMGDTALKAVAAYAVNRWGKKMLGTDATKAAVIILAWEAFESFVPEVTTFVHDKLPAPSGLTTPTFSGFNSANTFTPALAMQGMNSYPMIAGRFG